MFDIRESGIPGCVELQPVIHSDHRGRFVKTVHAGFFREHGLPYDFAEQLYSVSQRGVLRGLHFQVPPHAVSKLVHCVAGEVFDVVVDLRRGSPTYGDHRTFNLSAQAANQIFVPAGLAHGYYAIADQAIVVYNTTGVHAPDCDKGIHWASVGAAWPGDSPILTDRDRDLPPLADFDSPFRYDQGTKS
jgi:dTDP-4-dehydrorhamnose 3,5-epimerase